MPRTARAAVAGYCYHVVNRGNRRAEIFHNAYDHGAFRKLLREANAHVSMRVLGYCLMPNHLHLILWPPTAEAMADWMHWLLTTHGRRYNVSHRLSGHVWQGRYKAFPIQEDDHLLTVLRYVERNPLRANLVTRAEDWLWSSLPERMTPPLLPFLHLSPVPLPADWSRHVNEPQTEAELERIRQGVRRGSPFGADGWVKETAATLGLEYTLRPRGRPPRSQQPPATEGELPFLQKE